ncbi:hypothetical protein ABH926_009311 [Catenulispora sp. GP43]|uniref:toll/interleukin-1 receptor domain-containing protein n=1 Tax=Catenulispora sp. GP43 TaxID=3156263 RepID=UPI00351273D9
MPDTKHLIFVNYRGTDEIWATEYVHARMTEAFGADVVFKAGNSLRPGEVYAPILEEKAAHCPVMLVCMGPAWLGAPDASGTRRLDSPDDWVRKEIRLALRAGNLVVPLLIGNHGEVSVPDADALPPDLRDLVTHQARRLAPGGGLDATMPALIEELAEAVPELGACRTTRLREKADQRPASPNQDAYSTVFNIDRVRGDVVGRDKNVGRQP